MARDLNLNRKQPNKIKELKFNFTGAEYDTKINDKNQIITAKETEIKTLSDSIVSWQLQSNNATSLAGTCSAQFSLHNKAQECRNKYHAIRDEADAIVKARTTLVNNLMVEVASLKAEVAQLGLDKARDIQLEADNKVKAELASKGLTTESVLKEAEEAGKGTAKATVIKAEADAEKTAIEASQTKGTKKFQRIIIVTVILILVTYGTYKVITRKKD